MPTGGSLQGGVAAQANRLSPDSHRGDLDSHTNIVEGRRDIGASTGQSMNRNTAITPTRSLSSRESLRVQDKKVKGPNFTASCADEAGSCLDSHDDPWSSFGLQNVSFQFETEMPLFRQAIERDDEINRHSEPLSFQNEAPLSTIEQADISTVPTENTSSMPEFTRPSYPFPFEEYHRSGVFYPSSSSSSEASASEVIQCPQCGREFTRTDLPK